MQLFTFFLLSNTITHNFQYYFSVSTKFQKRGNAVIKVKNCFLSFQAKEYSSKRNISKQDFLLRKVSYPKLLNTSIEIKISCIEIVLLSQEKVFFWKVLKNFAKQNINCVDLESIFLISARKLYQGICASLLHQRPNTILSFKTRYKCLIFRI